MNPKPDMRPENNQTAGDLGVVWSAWLEGLPTKSCPTCGGRGTVSNPVEIGAALTELRKAAGLSCREMARRMNFTAAYICDLEHGRRAWKANLFDAYMRGLKPSNAPHEPCGASDNRKTK